VSRRCQKGDILRRVSAEWARNKIDESRLLQALTESCHDVRKQLGRRAAEKSDHRQHRLLRARREWPRNH
jgi:hypothetical protein